MKQILLPIALIAGLVATALAAPASAAECYADYKAKRDNPLKLHYGIVQLRGGCDRQSARAEVSARLQQNGWTLLNVVSVFGPEGLQGRRANAGRFYLRF
ncbi:hypothetical protein [Antarcticimicrobium sediminis]|uniref:Uncharacterized protein n=1 Tax=Antarcticimicrobium sediminis TaxID=2546227 RepID=A0A4R5EMN8_9RHOB|nr:hypothetical protein [Antarcticimicrobium sediminis]TDE35965.1 hypothetical protein E1B25_15900 [Antarcticimicrobium sediminis]